jgi:quinoprotein glucose dehydrogenase
MAVLAGGVLLAASLTRATDTGAAQGKALVRGNVPGEWRYWAGDAWGTRYSSLDQINASNFDSLKVAWTWGSGPPRSTPTGDCSPSPPRAA